MRYQMEENEPWPNYAVGRDPKQIELSVQTRINYDDLPATVATLQPLVEAGATHLVLMLNYPYPDGIVARLADEVWATTSSVLSSFIGREQVTTIWPDNSPA